MTQLSVWSRICGIPLSTLKREPTETLVNLIDQADKDVKEAFKAKHWLEGIIKLREVEGSHEQADQDEN